MNILKICTRQPGMPMNTRVSIADVFITDAWMCLICNGAVSKPNCELDELRDESSIALYQKYRMESRFDIVQPLDMKPPRKKAK